MIRKNWEKLEFELSMGNIGNKFEKDVEKVYTLTEPNNPIFDGKYNIYNDISLIDLFDIILLPCAE